MQKYINNVTASNGDAIRGALITVQNPDTTPAQLYSDNGVTPVSQPLVTDSLGGFSFYAADGRYNLFVHINGVLVSTITDILLEDPADGGATQVSFIQSGTGAVQRTVQDELRETVKVRQFVTNVVDGVTVNQAGIVNAVAEALARGAELEWAPGTYVSDANIPNFHGVRHIGPGVVKRGSALFYVQPRGTQSNTLNVAASGGSAANDGLGTGQSMATFQNAFDAMKNYGPMLTGIWNVVAAAGTYTINAVQQTHLTPSLNRVVIRGPAAGHPNVPTCIIDGTGGGDYAHGLSMSGIGVRVTVRDIKFQNFASNNTRIGLVGENESDFYTDNIHADNCDWCGIYAFNTVRARIQGGKLNACRSGFIANCTEATLGYGATNTAQGTVITNCTESGVYWSRGSQGHVDYCTFEDNAIGFLTAENSRCDTIGNDFKRNTVAIRARTGGVFGEGGAPNVFNNGTADANTTNIEYKAYSGDTGELAFAESWLRVGYDRTLRSASGTTPTTLTTPYTILANRLKGAGKSCRVHAFGTFTQATAGSTLTISFGGMSLVLTVPVAATNATFELDVELVDVAGGYRAFGKLAQGLNAVRYGQASAGFVNTSDQAISISATLANAGDSMNIYRTDVYLMG